MFNVKIVFKGKSMIYFRRFYTYDKALDFVYSKQMNYSNFVTGYIFDIENQLEIRINKQGLISCLSA